MDLSTYCLPITNLPVRYNGEGNCLSFLESLQVQRICPYFSVFCHKVWMIGTCSRGSVTIMITLVDHCSWEERSYMDRNFRIKFFSEGFNIWLWILDSGEKLRTIYLFLLWVSQSTIMSGEHLDTSINTCKRNNQPIYATIQQIYKLSGWFVSGIEDVNESWE